ncbi:MAG: adenine/guanine/hypoxanthine permease [Acidobacteriaceae bacterium]|jgi:AGZA family xanthine/uracil permease-like MFS transporter|nr:adenine/guanine/hypoxanthine permease [Acidobacteriaceae bacterium]
MRQRLEAFFEFSRLHTTWKTEILAGFTTFITMAYIVLINPAILHEAGMPLQAVTAATCLSAAVGCILMGVLARYPIALAPGMGLNAYFTYSVVRGLDVPWQTALGVVFLSGVAFLLLTLLGLRQRILRSIPHELNSAIAAGIGLFIAFIGLRNCGLVTANAETLVTLGRIRSPQVAIALFGVLLIAALEMWRVRGSILLGIVGTTLGAWLFGLVHWKIQPYQPLAIRATLFHLDIPGALHIGLIEIVFVFLFVDLFDNLGTLVAVTKKAGLIDANHEIPRLHRVLLADSLATLIGSLVGTSTVTSYVESGAGVAAGGRSGVTAITTGLLFLVALLGAPFLGALPAAATAPALIIVGSLMVSTVSDIPWSDPLIAVPAFLTIIMIPLTYSIANGLGMGILSYAGLRILAGRLDRKDWLLYVLAILFLARFLYLSKA